MPVSFTAEDIEYLRHGERALLLRLFRPEGRGPFPVVVDLHGGAWNDSNRLSCAMRCEMLAQAGIAGAALDFRQAADGYPTSLADINYAIRWLKANAARLRLDPKRVGLTGASSGGHLAMLSVMRPSDPRYSAINLDGGEGIDARVNCVGLVAPVINPLSRYRRAVRARQAGNPPAWVGQLPERHDRYWKTEAAMAEGSPVLALERGEPVEMRPAIYVQGRPDENHIYRDPDGGSDPNEQERFVRLYRQRGGEIDLVYVDTAERQSPELYAPMVKFFAERLSAKVMA